MWNYYVMLVFKKDLKGKHFFDTRGNIFAIVCSAKG